MTEYTDAQDKRDKQAFIAMIAKRYNVPTDLIRYESLTYDGAVAGTTDDHYDTVINTRGEMF